MYSVNLWPGFGSSEALTGAAFSQEACLMLDARWGLRLSATPGPQTF